MPFYVPAGNGSRKPKKITSIKNSYGNPKWFDAVYTGDIEYIKKHIKSINTKDDLGYTALHHAAIAGNVEVVSLLIEQGEAIDAKGQDGATPLRCAVQEGQAGVVAVLLANGGNVDELDEDELTLLHCAADAGHEPIARLLLCKAPHLANYQSRSGWTPLHSAAVMGHPHIVKLLVEYSANIRLLNNQGKTCLDLAKDRNKTDVLKILERLDQIYQTRLEAAERHDQSRHQNQQIQQQQQNHHQNQHQQIQRQESTSLEAQSTRDQHNQQGETTNTKTNTQLKHQHSTQEKNGDQDLTSSSNRVTYRKSLVRRVLECPVCLEQMTNRKILQCMNGHNVCDDCRPKLVCCPQCRVEYTAIEVRNRGLEELASSTSSE